MQLTPEQEQLGKENFNEAVSFTRRNFLVGAAAAVPTLGAAYFGYSAIQGSPVKVGFIGSGDEGSVLLTQHPKEYMDIVAVADLRAKNRVRALNGDGNEVRIGLIKKLGHDKAMKVDLCRDHKEMLKKHPEIEAVVIAVPLIQHAQVAIDCLKAGKHVLTEKLMAHKVIECKQMIRVARQEKKLLAVGHQRHYNVAYDNANALIQAGLLGDLKFIRAQWHRNNSFPGSDSWRPGGYTDESFERKFETDIKELEARAQEKNLDLDEYLSQEFGYPSMQRLVNWRLYNNTGGGLMAELGSHQLDAASIFLGKVKPIACMGYGGKNYYGVKGIGTPDQQGDDRDVDDHVYMTFEFPGKNYEQDKNDVCIVTYSSINTNRSAFLRGETTEPPCRSSPRPRLRAAVWQTACPAAGDCAARPASRPTRRGGRGQGRCCDLREPASRQSLAPAGLRPRDPRRGPCRSLPSSIRPRGSQTGPWTPVCPTERGQRHYLPTLWRPPHPSESAPLADTASKATPALLPRGRMHPESVH